MVVAKWREQTTEALSGARGEAIMKRVGMRLLNKEIYDALVNWRHAFREAKNRSKGEAIMKRFSGKLKHREMSLNFSELCHNYTSYCKKANMEMRAKIKELEASLTNQIDRFNTTTQSVECARLTVSFNTL